MSRLLILLYGIACYLVFVATFLYAIGFVAGWGVPKHIDNGTAAPTMTALAIDLGLLALFALQHSTMARPGFKRWWTRLVPAAAERSTYVLFSSLALALLFWFWRPLPEPVWVATNEAVRWALHGLSLAGWLLVLTGSFLINHFDLFGLRQVWFHHRRRTPADEPFVLRAYYRIVRHPLMLGFLVAFWATPTMSVGHLLFAVATTGYILVAVRFLEERDLVATFGDRYREYQAQVPMVLPWPRPARRAQTPSPDPAASVPR